MTTASERLLDPRRFIAAIGIVVYVVLYWAAYTQRIEPVFASVGFTYRPLGAFGVPVLACVMLPVLWLPMTLTRPSQLLYWVIYLLTYVPGCLVPFWASDTLSIGRARLWSITLGLCGAFSLIALIYTMRVPRLGIGRQRMSRTLLFALLAVPSAATYALSLSYFGTFNLVGFGDVSDLKDQLGEAVVAGGALFGYLLLAQMHSINPLLIAVGLRETNRRALFAGVLGQLFFYVSAGVRGVLMSPVILMAASITTIRRGRWFGPILAWGTAALPALLLLSPRETLGSTAAMLRLVYWRTLVIPPQIMGVYFDFFSREPLTLMGHVKGFSLLVRNPYAEPIPNVIAQAFWGTSFSANANFFAEGFAGLGIPGFFLVALVVAGAFVALDAACEGLDLRFAVLAVSFHALNLTNLSIFTSLYGSGFGLSILLLLAYSRRSPAASREGRAPALLTATTVA